MLNSPPISTFIVCLLMTPMISIFTLAIEFDCLFLAIFQSFHVFVSFIFDKLAPLNICFKRCFKSLFDSISEHKTVSLVPKTWNFSYSAFWSTCQWGAIAPPPLGYATDCREVPRYRLQCHILVSF